MTHPVGTRVLVDHDKYPGVWIVKSNGPRNARLESEVNPGRLLAAPHVVLSEAPGATAVSDATTGATVTAVDIDPFFHPGELVRVSGQHGGLYVVISDRGGPRFNLAKLGGANGKYLRVHKKAAVKVDPADVLK